MTDKKDEKTSEETSTQEDKKGETSKSESQEDNIIPKHRFDEVNEEAKKSKKKVAELTAKLENLEKQDLEEKEKYRELYEQTSEALKQEQDKMKHRARVSAIREQAIKKGVREDAIDDVVKLIDDENIEVDSEYTPLNADSVVDEFLSTKDYLLSKNKTNIGSDTTTDGAKPKTDGRVWKQSEIVEKSRDNKWYEENKDDILEARREGRVVNDL